MAEELARGCRGRLALGLPLALRPGPGGADASARGGPERRSFLRALPRRLLLLVLYLHLFWIGTTSLLILSYRFVQPSATVLMAYRAWDSGWKLRPPQPLRLRSVPVWFRSMLISVEDYKFYEHHGFDFEAIKRAYEIDKRLDQPLYGGSTLTMQVARTLFLVPLKSYFRKYLEVIVTVELEALLDKDRILELYFGYAEWGKGIFGAEAAARKYYGRGLRGLSRDEGARLIAVLSSPIKYRPDWFGKSLILRERYDFLARRYAPAPSLIEAQGGTAPAAAAPAAGAPAPTAGATAADASAGAGSASTPEAQTSNPAPAPAATP